MTDSLPLCPQCSSEHAYMLGALLNCPMCGHEWAPTDNASGGETDLENTDDSDDGAAGLQGIKDAFGTPLADGDSVTVIRDQKVKGSSKTIKVGTKVRNIRMVEATDGHDIDCKVDGFGPTKLKSIVVRKA